MLGLGASEVEKVVVVVGIVDATPGLAGASFGTSELFVSLRAGLEAADLSLRADVTHKEEIFCPCGRFPVFSLATGLL